MATHVYGVLGWLVQSLERTDYHTGSERIGRSCSRGIGARLFINLYMFHGGTNFGFMNGCSARGTLDPPQVTSYDYDALLDEEEIQLPNIWQSRR